jgi:hypothetical protein
MSHVYECRFEGNCEECLVAACLSQVVFPAGLTARQRALLHEVAEAQGLGHASSGDGEQRCIAVGNLSAPGQQVRLTGSEQLLRIQFTMQFTMTFCAECLLAAGTAALPSREYA